MAGFKFDNNPLWEFAWLGGFGDHQSARLEGWQIIWDLLASRYFLPAAKK